MLSSGSVHAFPPEAAGELREGGVRRLPREQGRRLLWHDQPYVSAPLRLSLGVSQGDFQRLWKISACPSGATPVTPVSEPHLIDPCGIALVWCGWSPVSLISRFLSFFDFSFQMLIFDML